MRRGGVSPLPLWVAILREGVNPSPTLSPFKLMALFLNWVWKMCLVEVLFWQDVPIH